MWLGLKQLGVTEEDVVEIADHSRVLPDYKNNPRVATVTRSTAAACAATTASS